MSATSWFHGQSFNSGPRDDKPTVRVGEYVGVPADHHIHFCTTCQKDYPCTSQHHRFDEATRHLVPDTPPRATKRCPECAFMGF